jgi:hypothetical protein
LVGSDIQQQIRTRSHFGRLRRTRLRQCRASPTDKHHSSKRSKGSAHARFEKSTSRIQKQIFHEGVIKKLK